MAVQLNDKLVDNTITREELNNRVVIRKTSEDDFDAICETLARGFGLNDPSEVEFQLTHSNALLNESVKLVDAYTGEIYGLLIFTEYPIHRGSPLSINHSELANFLAQYKQVNGHSFIIDKRLRGLDYDKEMLMFNLDFLQKNYDCIWCAVDKTLKSQNYWQKNGFMLFFTIPEASFFIMPLRESWIEDIYKYGKNDAVEDNETDYC